MTAPQFYLASQSPRRVELLTQLRLRFETLSAPVDETRLHAESPHDYVTRLARAKARAGVAALAERNRQAPVLGADTTVCLGEQVYGKPENELHAKQMWRDLGGHVHQVLTAVAVADAQRCEVRVQMSEVHFRAMSAREAHWYWHSGEPCDKAGGYAIQGLGAIFVEHIAGSYSGIMGLPLFETVALLQQFGITPIP